MDFCIAPIRGKYRGMGRSIDIPWNSKTKKVYKQLLEKYFLYIELECNGDYDYESLEKMITFYKELCTYGISCEMIAFSNEPLEQVHGYPIELLGIDIVHDMCESLIEDEINPQIAHLLNENGLCDTEADVEKIIPFQDHGGVEWLPCYVYKIVLGNIEVKKEKLLMTNNRELFLTWIKNLFYMHCALFVVYLITLIPLIGGWFNWISTIGSIAAVFCLYKLLPVSERYRKAAIFSGISVGLSLVGGLFDVGLVVSIVGIVFHYIGLYQEFYGHAEVLLTIDSDLAKKWHTFFNWRLFGGIIVGIVSGPVIAILAVVLLFTEGVIAALTVLVASGFELVLKIMYLVYLKRTHDVCERYPHWTEETPVEEI